MRRCPNCGLEHIQPAPPFKFRRYVNGLEMAEGVTIEQASCFEEAMLKAVRLANRQGIGRGAVLVLEPQS
jgi:hypothetical protein